jgi:hypothetical protein
MNNAVDFNKIVVSRTSRNRSDVSAAPPDALLFLRNRAKGRHILGPIR